MKNQFIFLLIIILLITIKSGEAAKVIIHNGLKLKVITKDKYTVIRKKPSHTSSIVQTLGQFNFLYAFSDSSSKKNSPIKTKGFYKVGPTPSGKDTLGWVHEKQVFEWNHRECLRFTSMKNRNPAKIYEDEKAITKVIQTEDPEAYPPISEEFRDTGNINFKMLLPIVDSKNITHNGKLERIYKIAYLHYGNEDLVQEHRKIDIVFVMDTTRSMQNYIDELKKVIAALVDEIPEEEAKYIRFGFIGYRDRMKDKKENEIMKYIDGNKKYTDDAVFRYSQLTNKHKKFLKIMDIVKEAAISSGDLAEAMLDGLYAAVGEIKATGWQKKGLSLVILIGDSSGHDRDDDLKNRHNRNINQILSLAAENRIRIIALKIEGSIKDIENKKNSEKHKKQMKELGAGISPSTKGGYTTIKYNGNRREKFGKQLLKYIKSEFELAKELARAAAQKSANEVVAKPEGMDDDKWTIIVNNLSPLLENKGKVSFSTGWISENQSGKKVVEPHILISNEELELMVFALNGIKVLTKSHSQKIFQTKKAAFERQTGEELSEKETFKDYIKDKLGLPVKSKLLQFTPSQIRQLSELKLRDINKAIEIKRQQLDKFLNNQDNWFNVNDEYSIGFLPIFLLP